MLSLELPPSQALEKQLTTSRILIIEDEDSIRSLVAHNLRREGYETVEVSNGREGISFLTQKPSHSSDAKIDLIILDLMLPEVNGLDICRVLRHRGDMTPILIISAKDKEKDRVTGLEVGADDYLIKPFGIKELIARCRALLRRNALASSLPPETETIRQFKEIVLYPQECRVTVRGKEINLSPKEFRLLDLFMTYPRRVWDREQLIENVWGADFLGDTKTVDVHVRWLREKLEADPSNPEYLITVRGFGYRFG